MIEQREALLARIEQTYQTTRQDYTIGDRIYTITHVKSLETVWQIESACDPQWKPFWAEMWQAAVALSEWLIEQDLRGQRVLELGCGLGLCGAVAADQGAQVLMVDHAKPSVLFSRYNIWPWRDRARVRLFDWRKPETLQETFDLIIGADIIYDNDEFVHLERLWRRHPDTPIVLTEGGRRSGDEFIQFMRAQGWKLTVQRLEKYEPTGMRHIEISPFSAR